MNISEKLFPNKTKHQSKTLVLDLFSDAFIVFFGVWTLVHQFSYFIGLNFFQSWIIALLLSSACVVFLISRTICVNQNFLKAVPPFYIWIAIVTSLCLSITIYRPDADDEHYLGLALISLDFTFQKMNSLPGLGGGYGITSYDFIRAAISYFTRWPIIYSFYVIGPGIVSIMVIIFQWRLYRLISIKYIPVAIVVFFIIMLSWGDIHRSPANLGYVKFFQGKGALVWLSIPAMLFYWLQFEKLHTTKSLVLLTLSAISGVGFSATGIPMALLMSIIFFAVGISLNKSKKLLPKRFIFLGVAFVTLIVLGVLIRRYFGYESSGVHTSVGLRKLNHLGDYFINFEMLHFVLGNTNRFWLSILALVLSPFILPGSTCKPFLRLYLLSCILLILIPISSAIMAIMSTASFAWRWLFICPFVLCIVILVDYILRSKIHPFMRVALASIFLCLFVSSGPLVVSAENHARFSPSLHQLHDEENIVLRPSPYNDQITKLERKRIISLKDGSRL